MPNPFAGVSAPIRLLILAPDAPSNSFLEAVQPLVAHKNTTGMTAMAISISSVKSYFSNAVDDAEAVKLAIKYAYENLSTQYVMLVGDSQNFPVRFWLGNQWVVPTFPAPNGTTPIDANPDGTFIQSDLYYSNLYHHLGTFPDFTNGGFDDWDNQSGSGLYNQSYGSFPQTELNPDHVDGFPDLAIGRIPANNVDEVTSYVNKVIAYETTHIGPSVPMTTFVHDEQYGSLDLTVNLVNDLIPAGWPPEAVQYLLLENYPVALSLASFNGKLSAAYIAEHGSGEILTCSSIDGIEWPSGNKEVGQKSVTGPSMAIFGVAGSDPKLWMAIAQDSSISSNSPSNGFGKICVGSSVDGTTWLDFVDIGQSSKGTPSLAVFGTSLCVAFTDTSDSDQIWVCSSPDGKDWTAPPSEVTGQNSCAAPALAEFTPSGATDPLLWMAFVTNDVTNRIYICCSPEGPVLSWSKIYEVTSRASRTAPSLAVFEGELWLAFAANDDNSVLVCHSTDGMNWTTPSQVPGQFSRATPVLTVFDNTLWIGFMGNNTNNLYVCSLSVGAQTTVLSRTELPYATRTEVAPFASASASAVAGSADDSFWISYIGHGGSDIWGHVIDGLYMRESVGPLKEEHVLQTTSLTGFPIVFAAACQTALFVSNIPWGVTFTDTNGNSRGPFNSVDTSVITDFPGMVCYEGPRPDPTSTPPYKQAWGTGPDYTDPAPAYSTAGTWSLPVNIPLPNVYNTTNNFIGKTWVIGSAPGGAIAYFGVHDVSIPGPDIEMEGYILRSYLESASSAIRQPGPNTLPNAGCPVLGDLYLSAQRTYWGNHQGDASNPNLSDYHSIPRLYLGWLVLFGDPSLRLPVITVSTLTIPDPGGPPPTIIIEGPGGRESIVAAGAGEIIVINDEGRPGSVAIYETDKNNGSNRPD